MIYRTQYLLIVFLIPLCDLIGFSNCNSFVVSSTESTKEESGNEEHDNQPNPQIYSMQIEANVSNRFARALITSKVRNLEKNAKETTFSVILPENAFISEFEMEIKEKIYKAYIKEKEEAKQIYQQAVSRGQSAAYVEQSARDSKTFTVSVNIEPESKTIFRLIYEELLQRKVGQYELIINIHPGQIVEDLGVQVHINESRPLTFVKTPSLRTGNEISKNDEKLDPSAQIDQINNNSAVVKFKPDVSQQKKFAVNMGGKKENGLAGQFVVQYDVERDPQGGEVLMRDGYFVHFFAPSELEPLPKHIVFVLDHSGSMEGRKIQQLIEAMQNILPELKADDLFNIVRFGDGASVWDSTENKFISLSLNRQYGNLEPHLRETILPEAVEASRENIERAKTVIKDQSGMSLTNIIAGLEVGLFLSKKVQEKYPSKYQPMIVFLTDGLPNVGMSSGGPIINAVTKINSGTKRVAIFSLSFGSQADKDFLRKLSSQNLGFSRHIYEAADASLQLQDFYRIISSPIMSDITFKYVDGVTNVTKTHYPILFNGSELVIAGKTGEEINIFPRVKGTCLVGKVVLNTTHTKPVDSLERLWAYLTVKQLLVQRKNEKNETELTNKALDLSLKYSFVTAVSSLVVVKPNENDSISAGKSNPRPEFTRSYNLAAPRMYSPHDFLRGGGGSSRIYHSARPSYNINAFPTFGGSSGTHDFARSSYNINGRRMMASNRRRYHFEDDDDSINQPSSANTRRPTSERPSSTTKPQQNSKIPQWLDDLKKNNENITTSLGSFKLGQSGDVITRPECPKTPFNSTGVCTIIFDCPQVYSALIDMNIYIKYFCPLNEYAGVCCPTTGVEP